MSDPKTRYERGLDVTRTLSGSDEAGQQIADHFESLGALGAIAHSTAAGEIWSHPDMSRRDRSLCVISMLTAMGRELELRTHIAGGLNHGLEVDELDEIMVQAAVYIGLPPALAGARLIAEVLAERAGTETRPTPPAPMEQKDDEKRTAAGADVIRTIVGMPEGTDMTFALDGTKEQLGVMGPLTVNYAFGDVWTRPQLSRRDRSLVVVSSLTALNLTHELEIHIGAALNHGVTEAEVEQVMMTCVAYGGFPRAIDGMHLAKKVFAARAEAAGS